ncbi:hypothetical protein REPUB_Repub03eG0123000 [Reevesia pubescens]
MQKVLNIEVGEWNMVTQVGYTGQKVEVERKRLLVHQKKNDRTRWSDADLGIQKEESVNVTKDRERNMMQTKNGSIHEGCKGSKKKTWRMRGKVGMVKPLGMEAKVLYSKRNTMDNKLVQEEDVVREEVLKVHNKSIEDWRL